MTRPFQIEYDGTKLRTAQGYNIPFQLLLTVTGNLTEQGVEIDEIWFETRDLRGRQTAMPIRAVGRVWEREIHQSLMCDIEFHETVLEYLEN